MLPLVCLLAVPLSGCGPKGEGQNSASEPVSVYYLVDLDQTPPTRRDVIQRVDGVRFPGEATPEGLLELLLKQPENAGLRPPLPPGTAVRGCTREGKDLVVDLTKPYGKQTGYDLTRANCAIAMTLTQLPGIESVSVLVEGEPLPDWGQTALRQSMILQTDAEETEFPLEVALYFWDPVQNALAAEHQTVPGGSETAQAARIVQALIDGPRQEGRNALLPRNTTLLSVSVEHRCCTLVLSDVFWQEAPKTPEEKEAVLRSVVDSLKNLDFIETVCFRDADGRALYGDRSLEQPIS